ncbi:unnamed protein product [Pleuronectes platessa]|uniref:Uncharacterized protein n=1 Tax=Pleuronectes platessa TaxID=8262 RepID=A0A9N7UI45_PLEPL|nr:unnamed protein product [Pleuronectes platessa]
MKYWWFRQAEVYGPVFEKEWLRCCSCERIGEDMERTEHLSSSGGMVVRQNTRSSGLEGRQSTGDQTLALGPAAGFHSSLPSPPDLGHIHCAVDEQRKMLRRKQRRETCRCRRYQQSLRGLKFRCVVTSAHMCSMLCAHGRRDCTESAGGNGNSQLSA